MSLALFAGLGGLGGDESPSRPVSVPVVVLISPSIPGGSEAWAAYCGGWLLTDTVVATAAHCVVDKDASSVSVSSGPLLCGKESATRAPAASIVSPGQTDIDLAFILLAAPLTHAGVSTAIPSTSNPQVVGWSHAALRTDTGCGPRAVLLELVPLDNCHEGLSPTATRLVHLCAVGLEEENTCGGDSGSPVFVVQGSRIHILGLTLRGRGCAGSDPGLYLAAEHVIEVARELALLDVGQQ